MSFKNSEYKSLAISIVVHAVIIALLVAFKFSPEYDTNEYVTIGFGTVGNTSSAGAIKEKKKKVVKKKEEVQLPKVKNTDSKNPVSAVERKEKKEEKKVKPVKKTEKKTNNNADGLEKYGFELDFGGKGKRKIYSYSIPAYPPGVSKEIDVKLRFTILPDGSVGRIFPIKKADTRLEAAAISSLRQWRFEALPEGKDLKPQSAVITFPFRLQ